MSGYRIGAVARMTGVSTDTIRAWERRFSIVSPERGENNNRYYTDDHVALLTKIKRLVDAGQAIGTVARLPMEELDRRVESCQQLAPIPTVDLPADALVFSVQGPIWVQLCAEVVSATPQYVNDVSQLEQALEGQTTDFLLLDVPSLTEHKAQLIKRLIEDYRIRRTVVVFRYAANRQLQTLSSVGVNPIKGPIEPLAFARLIGMDNQQATSCYVPRKYSAETLQKLSEVRSQVPCECPRHLVEIIGLLNHFEEYCAECETETPGDARLHEHIKGLTSHARGIMERAMGMVLKADDTSAIGVMASRRDDRAGRQQEQHG